jgi:hypothetical protein
VKSKKVTAKNKAQGSNCRPLQGEIIASPIRKKENIKRKPRKANLRADKLSECQFYPEKRTASVDFSQVKGN